MRKLLNIAITLIAITHLQSTILEVDGRKTYIIKNSKLKQLTKANEKEYVSKDSHNIRLQVIQPPTIVFAHGSAWYFSDKRKHEHYISPFLQSGYNVINLNYC